MIDVERATATKAGVTVRVVHNDQGWRVGWQSGNRSYWSEARNQEHAENKEQEWVKRFGGVKPRRKAAAR